MQDNLMGLPQLTHGKIPISARLNSGLESADGITLPYVGRELFAPSLPITAESGDDGVILLFPAKFYWSKLPTFQNIAFFYMENGELSKSRLRNAQAKSG